MSKASRPLGDKNGKHKKEWNDCPSQLPFYIKVLLLAVLFSYVLFLWVV